ncbi:MAG: DUF4404 family protein [Gammaproteobacteria bacterium]|nr:DUF4404 family protein [Gammaproteobacteria bacterium]MDH3768447.1 DUF4404 family protein [Gammaproteobacteria bacterium]
MSEKELTDLLHEVHNELEDTQTVSDKERQLLAELMTDIRARLGDDNDAEHGLGDRLGDAAEQFAQSHPTLAFALRRVMDALAKMGI